MACAAGLLLALAPALSQAGGGAPFSCTLPEGYLPFSAVAGDPDAWEAFSADRSARLFVEHRLLESLGAKAELVARDQRVNFWQARFGQIEGFSTEEWKGAWGGLPDAAGFSVRYPREKRAMSAVERVGIVHDHFIHFVWEGPATGLQAALACAETFRVPDAWIPPPPPAVDAYRGLAPGTEAKAYPWRLEVRLDLVAWSERGVMDVRVRAEPIVKDGVLPAAGDWRLPAQATTLPPEAPDEIHYVLDPQGNPDALALWGIVRSPQSDLAACDAIWVAAPDPGPGRFLPPGWTLAAEHPGHLVLAGPDPAKPVFDETSQRYRTRFAPVLAGRSWPFFLAGRFEAQLHGGIAWKLRKDAKALTPGLPVEALARLQSGLKAWLPSGPLPFSVVSFPGVGDRALPGLFVLDESLEWFSQPLDSQLSGLSRRTWLARLAAASCFGVELRGSGNGAPVMENALAEYAAARLLEAAGWSEDAKALRLHWRKSEALAGALPVPLTLLPPEDVLGSQRILTAGALFWTDVEEWCQRDELDDMLRKALAAGRAWSTQDLVKAASWGPGSDASSGMNSASHFEDLLYSLPKQ